MDNVSEIAHEWVILKPGVTIDSEADLPATEEELLAAANAESESDEESNEGDETEYPGRFLRSGQIAGHGGDDRGDRPGGEAEATD